VFLDGISIQINDNSIEGNLFSHSSNPLLNMCLLYELLGIISKKFFSLNNMCQTIMKITLDMAIQYIEAVDDENFLTKVMMERDFSGRDALRIAVELELLDLIQAPKVEAIVKRIYNSDFDQAGHLYEMSTTYQMVFGDKNINVDIEASNRFYKKRELKGTSQSQWLF
jgi:hypothetical protein